MESQFTPIINIVSQSGINPELTDAIPLWAKYMQDSMNGTARALVIFPSGEIYNYSVSPNSAENKWYNWGEIKQDDLQNITSILENWVAESFDQMHPRQNLDHKSVLVQFMVSGEKYEYLLKKEYTSPPGNYLKAVNDAVNQALANRNKKP